MKMTLPIVAMRTGEQADLPESQLGSGFELLPAFDPARDALLLDVDGTLIDIAPSPEEVVVPADLKRDLGSLVAKTNGALALVSGRRLAALEALFAPVQSAAIGCHGAELRSRQGEAAVERVPPLSAEIRAAFSDIAALEPLVRVEDKTFSLAFHYRRAPDREQSLLARVGDRAARYMPDLMVLRGKAVVEVKSAGFNKGEAVLHLMGQPPFAGRRPIFLGDDETDEDVFAVLGQLNGIGISVGRQALGASFTIRGPAEVRNWLAELATQ
jgi:trehalose 6-phosphate phosphatase